MPHPILLNRRKKAPTIHVCVRILQLLHKAQYWKTEYAEMGRGCFLLATIFLVFSFWELRSINCNNQLLDMIAVTDGPRSWEITTVQLRFFLWFQCWRMHVVRGYTEITFHYHLADCKLGASVLHAICPVTDPVFILSLLTTYGNLAEGPSHLGLVFPLCIRWRRSQRPSQEMIRLWDVLSVNGLMKCLKNIKEIQGSFSFFSSISMLFSCSWKKVRFGQKPVEKSLGVTCWYPISEFPGAGSWVHKGFCL